MTTSKMHVGFPEEFLYQVDLLYELGPSINGLVQESNLRFLTTC